MFHAEVPSIKPLPMEISRILKIENEKISAMETTGGDFLGRLSTRGLSSHAFIIRALARAYYDLCYFYYNLWYKLPWDV